MMIVDNNRCYVAVNDAACNLLKRDRRQLIGATIDSISANSDSDQIDEVWQSFLQSGSLCGQYSLLDGNGQEVAVKFNASANILPGRHLTIFVMADDEIVEEVVADDAGLSPREVQIIALIANGNRGAEVADLLALSPDTVRVHVRNAMRKLDARTRAHAVAQALNRGLISLDEN